MAVFILAAGAEFDNENVKNYTRVVDLSDFELHTRTRLDRNCFHYVLDLLHEDLVHQNNRNHAVPTDTQLLVGLSFLASGSFQWGIAAMAGVSQSTASDIIRHVVLGLNRIAVDHIKFPRTVAEMNATKEDFYRYGGVRNVLGVIDCTHVAFQPLKEEEAIYVDRRGHHTINVQLVCDGKLKITDVVAQWPGSVHDSFIWSNCDLRNTLLHTDGWLLGDVGYPLEPWLLTKFQRPTTEAQMRFNAHVGKIRNLIEIVNGHLKSRWRVLAKSGGEMLYRAPRVCEITVACCVLHNICVDQNVELGNLELELPNNYNRPPAPGNGNAQGRDLRARAIAIRNQLVDIDFAQPN